MCRLCWYKHLKERVHLKEPQADVKKLFERMFSGVVKLRFCEHGNEHMRCIN